MGADTVIALPQQSLPKRKHDAITHDDAYTTDQDELYDQKVTDNDGDTELAADMNASLEVWFSQQMMEPVSPANPLSPKVDWIGTTEVDADDGGKEEEGSDEGKT